MADRTTGAAGAPPTDNAVSPGPGKAKKANAEGPSDAATASDAAVPQAIATKFVRVDDRYYFPDRTLAFVDHGDALKARTHNTEVIRSLVAIAQARGWDSIQVTGTQQFRQAVWREGTQRGLDVKGYNPSELDQAAQRRTMDGAQVRSHSHTQPEHASAAEPPVGADKKADKQRPAAATEPLLTGRLVDAGPAPYKFDKKQGLSFFVKVRTDTGDRTLWGVDLERAIVESQTRVQIGDTVTVESRGSKPVTVKAPKRDAEGSLVGDERITTHRNGWRIEHPSYFEERAAKAAAFRDENVPRQELLRSHSDLTGAVVSDWLGEQFAARRIEHPTDRQRATGLFKARIATALEHGEDIPAPRMKADVVRRLDAIARELAEIEKRADAWDRRQERTPPRSPDSQTPTR